MKDVRPAIRTLLINNAAVSAIIGQRVYPNQLPQGVRSPSVVYNRITGRAEYTLAGSGGLLEDLFQIDSIAVDSDSATNLALAVHDALSAFKGPISGVTVRGIFRQNLRDLFDEAVQLNRMAGDYVVWYAET